MDVDASSGAEHLLRAVHDPRVPDAEIEQRVALKNAVVAAALSDGSLALPAARQLLYNPDLSHALVRHRPACTAAIEIVSLGCGLASLEDRVRKWSGDHERVLAQHLEVLQLWSDALLDPETAVGSLGLHDALYPHQVAAVATLMAVHPLKGIALAPLLSRTLTADLTRWPPAVRHEHIARVFALLEAILGASVLMTPELYAAPGAPLPPPIQLLPEDGGEFTLDPPAPLFYAGRDDGVVRIVALTPRRTGGDPWQTRLARAAARLLDGGDLGAAEYVGTCALEGWRVHSVGPNHAITLSIPDPQLPIAWLACSECRSSGYVQYSLDANRIRCDTSHAALGSQTPGAPSGVAGPIA
jgi:hypothetical protein